MAATGSDDDQTRSFTALVPGTVVTHYKIISKIGAGGMGEVYLAEDTQLDRKVALKFLPIHLSQDEAARTRFTREAKAAAKLDHPNIVQVFEVGEFQGRSFFAMAHIEGKSLREVIKEGKLSIGEAIELTKQICEGLHEAHSAGVIHRDIKPGNIIIDSKGKTRILDFGLATVAGEDKLTKTGSTLGTVGYMSPEQVEGKRVDHRSDLFSVGVILYEMLTGRRPFDGDNDAAVVRSITGTTPEPIARYKSGTTGELQRIIDKALTKDPSLRYQHADGMIADLKQLRLELPPNRKRRLGVGLLVAVVAIAVVFWGYKLFFQSDRSGQETKRIMLAVLPFENLGSDEDEAFADGMTDAIASRIAKISGLGVISRTSAMRYKNTDKTLKQIAAELGVDYILEGTIFWDKSGDVNRIRIIPELIQVAGDVHVWTDTYERAMTQIFDVQASIATSIARELDISLLQPELTALSERPTENMEAYYAYLAAQNQGDDIALYERATQLDSNFALAFAALSKAHSYEYHSGDHSAPRESKAKSAVDRALKLQPDLPEAHLALGFYYYWVHRNYDEALREFEIAGRALFNDSRILEGEAFILRRIGRFAEAASKLEQAFILDPSSDSHLWNITTTLMRMRDYDKAMKWANRGIEIFPESYAHRINKFWIYLAQGGDLNQARTLLPDIRPLMPWLGHPDAWLYLYIYEGNYQSALQRIDSASIEYYSSTMEFRTSSGIKGLIYRYMGDSAAALSAFSAALEFLTSHSKEFDEYNGFHSELGRVYAGLGSKAEAIREGTFAVDRMPVSKDATVGATRICDLAQIYVMVGEYEKAVELLEVIMSIPSFVSISDLKLDPIWRPLHKNPGFQALIEKHGGS